MSAMAAAGSLHSGWTGCDTVSGPTCTVTMNGARTVTATFALQRFTLTVSKSSPLGIGDGTVTSSSSPASSSQINCGSTCTASYNSGTVVTLNVAPALLSVFNGWNDCDAVSGTTCTVTMNRARSVTANFLP
jgi:Divergent InlB B-repeat domain